MPGDGILTQMRKDAEDEALKETNEITGEIVDAAIKVHRMFGPGLLESVYEVVLAHELVSRGLYVQRQHPVSICYEGIQFPEAFRVDLLVERTVVVELKAVEKLPLVAWRQVLTYLRLLHLEIGLLINFGAPTIKEGLHRVINGRPLSAPAPPRE